ncbi:MAG: AMP-binding protein [Alphaproteobacteria bacterium]|nr:AMP-binding protein [Alphaproteobacteria bacterium]MCB9930629.1 AMP-binding protein [Alphaproteobacteria bacterium]
MNPWQDVNRFGDLAAEAARKFGDHEGLVFQDRRHTFNQISEQVDRAARAAMAAGVRKGDHVAVWLQNSDRFVFIVLGLLKAGAVLVPINTRFRTNDLEYVLRQSDSSMLLTHNTSGPIGYLDMVREVVKLPATGDAIDDPNFPILRKVLILDDAAHAGTLSWDAALEAGARIGDTALAERANSIQPTDIALIKYTSGTTGFPKGAMHTHNIIRNVTERGFRMGITRNDKIMSYLPLFHAFGFSECLLMSIITGACQIVTETFDPAEVMDLVEREGASIVHGFEAHALALANEQERRPRDVSTLRTGVMAGGQLSATPVLRKMERLLAPIHSVSGHGMTETWIGVGLSALDDSTELRHEASGYPGLGFDVRIQDLETGELCPVGQEGELQVRGRFLMQGYYKKPKETAESYTADGWFKTGDTAKWRTDGVFRFVGRHKDMLKVGGENVDPMEVEGLLLDHPGVHQVAVVGCPDEKLSEVAVAYVERVPGGTVSEEDVIGHCRGKVASFKIPRHVVFLDAFPMTASGKIRKVELRADAAERFAPA